MNEGVFPSKKTNTFDAMEEERRLAFVAVTRAEKGLYLTDAEGRTFDGCPKYISRFILDIDEQYLTFVNKPREGLIADSREYISMRSSFLSESKEKKAYETGQRVRHSIFGDGTILDSDPEKMVNVIQFDDMETPRSISFKAKLEKI
jgi:DNA helicase-2/ATP-dependent DNA helicase PcrA